MLRVSMSSGSHAVIVRVSSSHRSRCAWFPEGGEHDLDGVADGVELGGGESVDEHAADGGDVSWCGRVDVRDVRVR